MKRLLHFLPLLLFFFDSAWASVNSKLSTEAQDAIYQYFFNSDRKVKSLKIELHKKLSGSGLDYLVEGEVVAQSPVDQRFITYHCGVFMKRDRMQWIAVQTVCEALPATDY